MKAKVVFFLIVFCSLTMLSQGQTILNPGDLVILGVDANLGGNPDEISFACFKDILPGTEIQITDQGYERCNAGLWGSGEGGARLTRTGGTILAGTVITVRTGQASSPWISFTNPDTLWSVANLGTGAPTNNFNLNSGGDQVYFAQGGTWISGPTCSNQYPGPGGRMLFAFSTSGIWAADSSTKQSNLYPGMSCYNMAPTTASDFVKYTGPLTAATQKDWISRISNVTNWTKYTTSALYLAAAPDLHTKVIPIIPGTDADWTIPNPDTLCQNAAPISLNLLISGLGQPGGTWSGTGVTGNTFSPLGLSGTYNITYTNDCPCCISQTHTITVNPSPTVAVPSNITVCNNATITATNFVNTPLGGSFTWTNNNTAIGLNAGGSGNIGSFTATNTGTSPINATITVTPATTCPGIPSAYIITVNPTPTVTVPADIVVCNGATVAATTFASTPSGGTFIWTSNNTAIGLAAGSTGNINSFTATNTGSSPITATITVTPSVNACTGTSSTYSITVNPTPTVTVPANITICNGGTIPGTLFSSPTAGASFNWTNSNTTIGLAAGGPGDISSFTATNTGLSAITATITVTPIANTCTGTPSTYTIMVRPTDNPAFNYTPSTLCQSGADGAANITGGATGTFSSSPSGLVFLNNATGLIDVSASLVNTYIITFNTSTCPASATDTVSVKAAPFADFSYSGNYCPDDANPLPVLDSGATAGVFSAIPTGLVFVSTSTGEVNLATSTPGTYTITNTIAAMGGCALTSANSTLTINPLPNATASSNSAICEGQTLNLMSSGGSTFIWSGPDGFSSPAQNPTITNATISESGTYTVTVTNSYGCSKTAQTNVTINTTPTATASSNSAICEGQTLNLTSGGGASFTWSGPDNFTSTQQNPSISNATISASGAYTVTVTNALGCSDTANVSVTIYALPIVSLTDLANTYCIDANPVTLTGTPAGGTFTGPGVVGNTFNPSQAGVGGPYEVIYFYADANTCFNSDTVLVSINTLPLVNLFINPSTQIYTGEVVTITALPSNYSNYNFYIGNSSVQSGILNTYQSVSFINGNNVIVISSENGCTSSDTLSLDVKPFPNAFIPDENGENGVFLKGLDLQIINRWGQQLYNDNKGWDGTYKGQKVSAGTYYYVVKLTDIDKSIKTLTGTVNVVDAH